MSQQALTIEQRCDRLDRMIEDGRVIRDAWAYLDAAGRERACLLAALAPECAEAEDASACPADIMPAWLAELTPRLDDHGSYTAWPAMIRRYARVARRWHVLDGATWHRLEYTARRIAVEEAVSHTRDEQVIAACASVVALCRREEVGDAAAVAAWDAAWDAASEAARAAAAAAAAWAAAAAAWAAARVEWAAARVAWDAASEAAAQAAAEAAARAASEAAWDRMADAILTAIEAACDAAEAGQ